MDERDELRIDVAALVIDADEPSEMFFDFWLLMPREAGVEDSPVEIVAILLNDEEATILRWGLPLPAPRSRCCNSFWKNALSVMARCCC